MYLYNCGHFAADLHVAGITRPSDGHASQLTLPILVSEGRLLLKAR